VKKKLVLSYRSYCKTRAVKAMPKRARSKRVFFVECGRHAYSVRVSALCASSFLNHINLRNRALVFIAAFSIVLLNATLIFGQARSIEKEKFWEAWRQSETKGQDKTYRSTETVETFFGSSSKPAKSSKRVFETIPPDKMHSIEITGNKKKESVRIGSKLYVRLNNGPWKIDNSLGTSLLTVGPTIESESYKVTENVLLNGQTVSLYEGTQKYRLGYESMEGSTCLICGGQNITGIWMIRYWISKAGLLLKSEYDTTETGTKLDSVGIGSGALPKKESDKIEAARREKTIYEYDPNIRIENPLKRKITKRLKSIR